MLFQYDLQGHRTQADPIGTIFAYNRDKHIVLAWLNREYMASKVVNGKHISTFIRGGHLAIVKRFKDNEIFKLSEIWIK